MTLHIVEFDKPCEHHDRCPDCTKISSEHPIVCVDPNDAVPVVSVEVSGGITTVRVVGPFVLRCDGVPDSLTLERRKEANTC